MTKSLKERRVQDCGVFFSPSDLGRGPVRRWTLMMTLLASTASIAMPNETAGCPFCVAVSSTLTDDLRDASAAVLAKCVRPDAARPADAQRCVAPPPVHEFRVVEVILILLAVVGLQVVRPLRASRRTQRRPAETECSLIQITSR